MFVQSPFRLLFAGATLLLVATSADGQAWVQRSQAPRATEQTAATAPLPPATQQNYQTTHSNHPSYPSYPEYTNYPVPPSHQGYGNQQLSQAWSDSYSPSYSAPSANHYRVASGPMPHNNRASSAGLHAGPRYPDTSYAHPTPLTTQENYQTTYSNYPSYPSYSEHTNYPVQPSHQGYGNQQPSQVWSDSYSPPYSDASDNHYRVARGPMPQSNPPSPAGLHAGPGYPATGYPHSAPLATQENYQTTYSNYPSYPSYSEHTNYPVQPSHQGYGNQQPSQVWSHSYSPPYNDASGNHYRVASGPMLNHPNAYLQHPQQSRPMTWATYHGPPSFEGPEMSQALPSLDGKDYLYGGKDCHTGCEPCGPLWQATVEVIGLRRQPANDHVYVTECCTYPAMSVGDLSFNYDLGVRASISRTDCHYGGWEFVYLGLPKWSASQTAVGDLHFNGAGFYVNVDPGRFAAQYDSSLHSFEINYRPFVLTDCFSNRCSFFAGFRYINFEETFTVSELNAPIYNLLQVCTRNNLYGVQFGNSYLLYDQGGPVYVETLLKFGIYANESSQKTWSSVIGPPVGASHTTLAYTGEFAIAAGYRLTPFVDIRAGYQLLGIGGVALAPDQLLSTDLPGGWANLHYNTLIAHGGFLGLTFRW